MRNKMGLLMLLAGLLLGGCQRLDRLQPTTPTQYEGSVVLLRGLADVFSFGIRDMANMLRENGVNAHDVSGPHWEDVGSKIITAERDDTLERPLVIVGHSLGADDAITLARYLNANDVKIDKLLLLDPVTPEPIPANVEVCLNIYRPNPARDWMGIFRGVPVEADNDRVELINYNIRDYENGELYAGINHFSIDDHEDVRNLVLREVLEVCVPRHPLTDDQHEAAAGSFGSARH